MSRDCFDDPVELAPNPDVSGPGVSVLLLPIVAIPRVSYVMR